ncbi:DUF4328 domain-containing protein [Streptomyces sp. NBC_01537]|uniref:DUF4328 domain-containing protein n=1 Tax=Streptomyces sp. NBC_01537 TaxID=2903896 RepID=UPI00386CC4B4
MPTTTESVANANANVKAPWLLARFAQGSIAAAVVADVFRMTAVRAGLASMVYVYAMTAAAVLFLVWLSRCRRNAELLSPGTAAVSGVWAVFAWLIPVVNLWVPRAFVANVQRASAGGEGKEPKRGLVNVWWGFLVAHTVVTAMGQLMGQGKSVPFIVLSAGLNFAAAALVIRVIQHITELQSAALSDLTSAVTA